MLRYLLARLGQAAVILVGITLITFLLIYLLPADPVQQMAGRSANPEIKELIRKELGLDRPLWEQYATYLGKLVQGDLGRALPAPGSVDQVVERAPVERAHAHLDQRVGSLLGRLGRVAAAGERAERHERACARGEHPGRPGSRELHGTSAS